MQDFLFGPHCVSAEGTTLTPGIFTKKKKHLHESLKQKFHEGVYI